MHQFLSIFHSLESDLLGHRAEQGLNCSQAWVEGNFFINKNMDKNTSVPTFAIRLNVTP